jgi:hypothetical protein
LNHQPSPQITRPEWAFVGWISLALLTLTSLPYLFAVLSAPPDQVFMGFILNVPDHAQYLSWYKAFQTRSIISNFLTPEANPPLFFNLLWWTLGRLGRYSGLSYAVIYQLFRWLAGAFFLAMVYIFAAFVFSDVLRRRAAFLFIALGSGLGWGLVVLKYLLPGRQLLFPLGVYIAEGNSFLCLLGYPHFAEAAGLILLTLWLLLMGERSGRLRWAVYAGLAALFLGWQHAYDLLIVWGVPLTYAAARWGLSRRWPSYWFKAMLIVALLSWPPALYSVLLTRLNPIWEKVLAQFANAGVYSPDPLRMFILMGLPLAAALVTLGLRLREGLRSGAGASDPGPEILFAGVWFVIGWALVYVPTDFQIHMLNSWQIPIGLLATVGVFDYLVPAMARRWAVERLALPLILGVVILIAPTNVYLWLWRFVDLNRHTYPYYLYKDEVEAMRWLEDNALADAAVFSALDTGQYIPGLSHRRVFLGHWAQTVDFYGKSRMVGEFFASETSDVRRLSILEQYNVSYVFFGPAERMLGGYDPDVSPWLEEVFSSPRVKVYVVGGENQ